MEKSDGSGASPGAGRGDLRVYRRKHPVWRDIRSRSRGQPWKLTSCLKYAQRKHGSAKLADVPLVYGRWWTSARCVP